jgi:uncharacterized repeat protein (TIGR03803 family)
VRLVGIALIGTLFAGCAAASQSLPFSSGSASTVAALAPRLTRTIPFFSFRGKKLGEKPVPGLIGDTSDNLYGVTNSGGDLSCAAGKGKGCGLVYKLVHVSGLQYAQSVIHAFGGSDGAFPDSPLAGGRGTLYGTTSNGGPRDAGVVYSVSIETGRVRTLYAFKGGSDGAFPIGKLLLDSNGNLYGTTAFGGEAGCRETGGTGCGTVFVLNRSTKGYTKRTLYEFSAGKSGWEPWAGVISYKGKLYGTTIYGGNGGCFEGCGTIFELSASGKKRTVHEFAGGPEGAYAKSPLYVDGSGNFYGTTQNGGDGSCRIVNADAHGCGTIFKVSAGGAATVLHAFAGGNDGAQPYIGLTEFKGSLYGTTIYGNGVAFKIRPSGRFSTIKVFNGAGATPSIFLCAITNELNGTTSTGGKYGYGTIFKLAQ